ncbi:hypothetical protein BC628DRAFT_1388561 [Trametes gibbosa]|nr:hypothetical protein BC628DRAFT_1388561 [Trametes gibbosa]
MPNAAHALGAARGFGPCGTKHVLTSGEPRWLASTSRLSIYPLGHSWISSFAMCLAHGFCFATNPYPSITSYTEFTPSHGGSSGGVNNASVVRIPSNPSHSHSSPRESWTSRYWIDLFEASTQARSRRSRSQHINVPLVLVLYYSVCMPLVFEVSCDVPSELYPGRCEGFEEYITLTEQLCYDYRHPPDLRRLYVKGQHSVREYSPARLRYGLRTDDGPLMLEYCLRALAVCHPLISSDCNPLSTSQRLAGLEEPPNPTDASFRLPDIKNVTPRLRLQGLACSAHIGYLNSADPAQHLKPFSFDSAVRDSMYHACAAANLCVGLDFVPPVTLRIASWLATTRARFGLDVRKTANFRDLQHLWSTHSNYISRLHLKEAARLKKIANAPHLYRCAAPGCAIQTTKKSALLKCGGSCSPERKPRYCSVGCQRKHWYIHREFCKPGNTSDYTDIIDDDGDLNWLDVDEFRPPVTCDESPWSPEWPLFAAREGDEIFIDIPNDSPFRKGEIMRVKTRTLSPMCLQAYYAVWVLAEPTERLPMRAFIEKLMTGPPPNMGFPCPQRAPDSLEPW